MCKAMETKCHCGGNPVNIHYKNNVLPFEAIEGIYCPDCRENTAFDKNTMLEDNGWIISYDMEVAKTFAMKMGTKEELVTPDFIFTSGYCTWNGFSPNDIYASAVEKEALKPIARENPRLYMEKMKDWTKTHIKKLSEEGWKKAKAVQLEMED